jgi:hypothetical protein
MTWQRLKREPVALQAAVQASLALLVSFGLHLSIESIGALTALSAALLAILTRRAVVPVAKLRESR